MRVNDFTWLQKFCVWWGGGSLSELKSFTRCDYIFELNKCSLFHFKFILLLEKEQQKKKKNTKTTTKYNFDTNNTLRCVRVHIFD